MIGRSDQANKKLFVNQSTTLMIQAVSSTSEIIRNLARGTGVEVAPQFRLLVRLSVRPNFRR